MTKPNMMDTTWRCSDKDTADKLRKIVIPVIESEDPHCIFEGIELFDLCNAFGGPDGSFEFETYMRKTDFDAVKKNPIFDLITIEEG